MLLENTTVARSSSVSASTRRQQWSRRYRRYDVMFDELDSSTTGGTRSHRQLGKRELRWIIQATMLFCILAVGLVCSYLSITSPRDVERDGEHHTRLRTRSLTSTGKPECHVVAFERYGGVTIEVLAVLYLFIGIAIVADDYFIVALEVISEKLDIAPDVAGATFMAMGSSAPELFTNVASVLDSQAEVENDVGVGAIVGSALFNLLAVVGLSILVAPKAMKLAPFPVIRDACVYLISIVMLVYVILDEIVSALDAAIMVGFYVIYVLHLASNRFVVRWLCPRYMHHFETNDDMEDDKRVGESVGGDDGDDGDDDGGDAKTIELVEMGAIDSDSPTRATTKPAVTIMFSPPSAISTTSELLQPPREQSTASSQSLSPTNRAGSPPRRRRASFELADAKRAIFGHGHSISEIDVSDETNDDGEEGATVTAARTTNDADGTNDASHNVGQGSTSHSTLDSEELGIDDTVATDDITVLSSSSTANLVEHEEQGFVASVLGGLLCDRRHRRYIFTAYRIVSKPLELLFRYTIPDCSPDGRWAQWYAVTFIMSLVWISAMTYVVVELIDRIGCTLGISQALMGLTIVAAGTSVPDCLGSLLVARKGEGDMAVSNAIGSNIFDILICLGVPWLVSALFMHEIRVAASGIVVSTFILLAGLILYGYLVLSQCFVLYRWCGIVMIFAFGLYLFYTVVAEILGWNQS